MKNVDEAVSVIEKIYNDSEKQEDYVDFTSGLKKERDEKFKDNKWAWKKNGELHNDRKEFLESLPATESYGMDMSIIHTDDSVKDTFHELSWEFGWDYQWLEHAIDQGIVEAENFDEFYSLDY